MKPFTVLLGIILGSSVAISFGLAAVLFIFWLLKADYPRVAGELPDLFKGALMFTGLTTVAGLGFLGVVRKRSWRYVPLATMWGVLAGIAWYYWPTA